MPRTTSTLPARAAVAWRRLVARRPWVHWALVTVLAAAAAARVAGHLDDVEAARRSWGDTAQVAVATRAHDAGEPLAVRAVDVPIALVPDAALAPGDAGSSVARRHVGAGEIVTEADVAGAGPLALVPPGWLAVPVVESPSSGAAVGDRVTIVSEGIVIAGEAIVVGVHDDVTLIAVPADDAPAVPAAATAGALAVLRAP